MIRKVRIENYKSISDLTLELGRVTVLIGENGSGKSNILEAIALASAAAQKRLENEFLTSRGIRVAEPRFMRSAFDTSRNGSQENNKFVRISVQVTDDASLAYELRVDETASYPQWNQDSRGFTLESPEMKEIVDLLKKHVKLTRQQDGKILEAIHQAATETKSAMFSRFLIYAPENSALRTFQSEGQILPLGIRGEGLFAHLKALSAKKHRNRREKIKESLTLIEWFENFEIPDDLSPGERSILIRDRFLSDGALFDQRSANEGFLFLLFYVTLFISPDTPAFFAIDNIDTSLNPKMCTALLKQLVKLAKEHDKQVIITTHNPAVLDRLDLDDDEQRLVVVERNRFGHTRVRRVEPPEEIAGQPPLSLSEAFMRGYIGGLPKNF